MEQLKNIINTYQDIIKSAEQKLGKAKQQIYRIGTLRLILFVAGIAGVIHFCYHRCGCPYFRPFPFSGKVT